MAQMMAKDLVSAIKPGDRRAAHRAFFFWQFALFYKAGGRISDAIAACVRVLGAPRSS